MSSTVGYDYSYVDREAQRRRQLRAEIAELRCQLTALETQAASLAKGLGRRPAVATTAGQPGRNATSDQLEVAAKALRAGIEAARQDVDEGLSRFWASRIGGERPAGQRRPEATAAEELARLDADRAAAASSPGASERTAAVAEAEELLARQGHRCYPADLDLLGRLLAELRSLERPAEIRERSSEIRAVVIASIGRRERQQKAEIVRSRLLTLIEDALSADQQRLRAMVVTAKDPRPLVGQVAEAVARADKARSREAVAQAIADALRESGYEVGENFAPLLVAGDPAVAAFYDTSPGYGLLVRLPANQTKLITSVVRRSDVEASPNQDLQAQRDFSDEQLEKMAGRLRERIGLVRIPFVRVAPGQRPVAAVSSNAWPAAQQGRSSSMSAAVPRRRRPKRSGWDASGRRVAGSPRWAVEGPARGTGPERAAPGATAPPPAGTRTAYARLDTPDRVAPRERFELRVGLAPLPSRGVGGTPMPVPVAAFTLTVQLIADGFQVMDEHDRVLDARSLTREFAVSPEDPYPYDVLWLRAVDDPALAPVRTITGIYSVEGRTVGVASRGVLVAPPEAAPAERPGVAPGVDWVLPSDPEAPRPDLEIVVAPGNDATSAELAWFYRSRHEAVGSALVPRRTRLPGSTAEWARAMVRGIEDHKDAPDLAEHLLGRALEVCASVPGEIWAALEAAARISSPPTVLLGTWEPFIPWELARVPKPWDAESPPFLGAQAVIGRWSYSEQVRSPVPPARIEARSMGVVWGEYVTSRLPEAEKEGADLERRYAAVRVEALVGPILDCLKGKPAVDLLHFAVHGNLDFTGTRDGIQMVDRSYLGPPSVRGVEHTATRMVFLNACQVAGGQRALGEYAGMAAALIGIEVGAVVAPLWKVDDSVAREVAEEFYRAVLGPEQVSPAELLRRERRSTKGREGSPAGTRLAYLFFGHPLLRVDWTGPRDRPGGDDA